jgi:hypothetical protein
MYEIADLMTETHIDLARKLAEELNGLAFKMPH